MDRSKIAVLLAALLVGGLIINLPAASAGLTRNVIYQPPKAVKTVTLDGLPEGGTVETVRTADGLDLKGIVYRGDGEGDMFLVFHGNASTANGTAQWLRGLTEHHGTVIFAEYRGYSGNPGKPTEKGTALDADAWSELAFKIAMQEHHSQRVIYLGHSLGGGVAFQAAEQSPPYVLLTVGTFTDTPSLAPKIARGIMTDRYDNKAKLRTLRSPYYIIHGTDDRVVPVSHAKALFETAEQAGIAGGAVVFDGEGHQPSAQKVLNAVGFALQTEEMKGDKPLPNWQGAHVMRFRKNVAAPSPAK